MVSPWAPSTVLPNRIFPPPKLSTILPDCPSVTVLVEALMDDVIKPFAAPLSPRLPPRPTYSTGKKELKELNPPRRPPPPPPEAPPSISEGVGLNTPLGSAAVDTNAPVNPAL